MRQRHNGLPVTAPVGDSFVKAGPRPFAEMIALRVAPDEKGQLHFPEQRQQARAPQRRAFPPRRQIRALHRTGIAKAHRGDGDAGLVVKHVRPNAHPIAQPITRWIGERRAALMHTPARRLPDDQDAGIAVRAQHRARLMRQRARADAACAYLVE